MDEPEVEGATLPASDTDQPVKVVPTSVPSRAATPLTPQLLAELAHAKLGPRVKAKVTESDIRSMIDRLEFTDLCPEWRIPRLLVTRLRFTGVKRLLGKKPAPINYDQTFQPGVNVILVKANGVGKSSILKTIKFALTGDDTEYDEGVRSWIENIWLHFKLDEQPYTMLLAQRDGTWQGMLADKEEDRTIEVALKGVVHRTSHLVGTKAIQSALANFFFQHYSLSTLCWTRKNPHDESQISQCEASWRTYFQAMRLRDDDHKYLLCGPDPAVAHQDNLLFTTFLGLQLAEPLNKISVESSLIEKSKDVDEERLNALREKRTLLQTALTATRSKIADIEKRQAEKMDAFLAGDAASKLAKLDLERTQFDTELVECKERLKSLSTEAQRFRAEAQRIRTLAQLKKLFSGLDVTLCPRCNKPVSEHAIGRESTTFECRLCSEPVAGADTDTGRMEAKALDYLHQADTIQKLHTETSRRIKEMEAQKAKDAVLAEDLRKAATLGASYAKPTDEERADLARLYQDVGSLNQQIGDISRQIPDGTDNGDTRKKLNILEAIKAVLTEEAEVRNGPVLKRLSEITTRVINAIGAKEFTGLHFSSTGRISFLKNESTVHFTKLNNPGERFRVKLAVMLSLMQLGREKNAGHHPGLLLIDQPGAAEMVPDNRHSFAVELKRIDEDFSDQVQIICFTAKPDFADATVPEKLYGPQAPDAEGGPYAF